IETQGQERELAPGIDLFAVRRGAQVRSGEEVAGRAEQPGADRFAIEPDPLESLAAAPLDAPGEEQLAVAPDRLERGLDPRRPVRRAGSRARGNRRNRGGRGR